jgi:tRNA threonylcarbamoyladenosine biosynthesis protein TsaE
VNAGFSEGVWEALVESADETAAAGGALAGLLAVGNVVLFSGELGAGKTTMIRGLLAGLGYHGTVRSPTFNLIQTFLTEIPVMHADLYRLKNADGIGLEEYFATHLCLIEWPDRLGDIADPWRVNISFLGEGRLIRVERPPFENGRG